MKRKLRLCMYIYLYILDNNKVFDVEKFHPSQWKRNEYRVNYRVWKSVEKN